ncbi:hypothetical protein D2A34_01430 [Clostridium chromiireducens]|uniref:Uncharacterized protein n=2 Tax=Clostridium chromiireducens TaxID=225345 RepID=A0A1V4IN79_9CLOT|nr:hypothetical protein CLCHR_25850 [Clostridium chromiireducens]RII36062.1 hypothetical protein D2A34_01430 [Clostridium chromiireducens]
MFRNDYTNFETSFYYKIMIIRGENEPDLKIKVYKLNAYTKKLFVEYMKEQRKQRKGFKFRKVGKDLLKGSFK